MGVLLVLCVALDARPRFARSAAPAAVRVIVRRTIEATPRDALDAFWQRTWLRGGGAPLPSVRLDVYGNRATRVGSVRTLWPLGMVERVDHAAAQARGARVRYSLVQSGALFAGADIRHTGELRFSMRSPGGTAPSRCELAWSVSFTPPRGSSVAFWQRVTALAIGGAADDLVAHVRTRRPQRTLVVRAPLRAPARRAWREWARFVWSNGGGLRVGPVPAPPPIRFGARGERLILPPGLVEQLLLQDEAALEHTYAVLNPGLLVLYPCSEHAGVVRFRARGRGACLMEWVVRLRPRSLGVPLATSVTETVVLALARNFARELKPEQAWAQSVFGTDSDGATLAWAWSGEA
ncbi:hypothetical protein KFE25_008108 [Diacronema lutheri]|uniref:SRPBCC family protein n=2 Tax=Diacronema lutheri TaxID=2081491 RepID=A0A8J5XUE1_DIALT|nr:hypothetical protein KFE25_008108 [Diacronema lutheri]